MGGGRTLITIFRIRVYRFAVTCVTPTAVPRRLVPRHAVDCDDGVADGFDLQFNLGFNSGNVEFPPNIRVAADASTAIACLYTIYIIFFIWFVHN